MRRLDPPSNQTALPGLGGEGEELMQEARRWAATHYDEWQFYCREMRADADAGRASSDAVTHAMRRRFRVQVPNAYTPAFARIWLEQMKPAERAHYRPRIAMGRSKVDAFTEVEI
ncbi:hypothetical protein [Gordonibacter urolithinfaciens]|jgi:hypothetical protein|uniref:hypothetical protein n=1 Tax=Gordonibacter urolithinfaciens TaxID=1335613 RepID=UPI001D07262C|nr:hypothetical protein [Gordonibacter urolithinfaciens]MCB7085764.1 hypothetical protein [Gordonibacter urolithinfaciens]DAO05446.1 MAG TPA: hypothetical protein [Caudoviricetes sp.]